VKLGKKPEPPEETDPGWHQWKADNFSVFPWTREIHNMECGCDQLGQPASKVTPDDAIGLIEKGLILGECVQ